MSEKSNLATKAGVADAESKGERVEIDMTQLYVDDLRRFIGPEFTDEIPPNEIHRHDDPANVKYKVLKAWWTKVKAPMETLYKEKLILDENVEGKVREFIAYCESDVFAKRKRRTPEEIKFANDTVALVVSSDLRPCIISFPPNSHAVKKFEQLKERERAEKLKQSQQPPKPEQPEQSGLIRK